MSYNKVQKLNNGFATLELLIAFVILVIVLTTVITFIFSSQSISVDSQTNNEALYKAKQYLEEARALGRKNFFALADIGAISEDIYTKTLKVNWTDDYVKEITSRIAWNTELQRPQQVELTTMIASRENALRGDTCDPQLSADEWKNPQVLGYVDFPSNEGATDMDTRLKKVYLTTNPSAAAKPDLYIIDVSKPTNPKIIGEINTGNGLEAVKVIKYDGSLCETCKGKIYAYVANRSINAQLQIIDVTDPQNISLVANFKIPNVTGTGYGKSIFYKDGFIYLGLYKTTGLEFNIIDVSNPLSPQYVAGWELNATVNDIIVKDNNIAYLAITQPNPPTDKKNFIILDISNPANIQEIASFSPQTTLTQSGNSLFLDGDTLYLGRTDGANCSNCHELYVLDVSNPSSILVKGSKKIDSTITAMTLRENYLFMMTDAANEGFQIWDVSDPLNITKYVGKNIAQKSTGAFDCEGNLMYVGQESNRALQIIGP